MLRDGQQSSKRDIPIGSRACRQGCLSYRWSAFWGSWPVFRHHCDRRRLDCV